MARDVGALQILIGLCMLLPALVALVHGELHGALSLLIASVVTVAFGAGAFWVCRQARDPGRGHAMIIAGAGWFVSALFGALPFAIAARLTPAEAAAALVPSGAGYSSSLPAFRDPLHAFFESMSAYTTTGLTVAVHEPSLGHGLLFYRSLAQWIGGAGVIVLSLAIIPRPGVAGELELYKSEGAGTKLRPTIIGTARAIWKIYAGLTALSCLYLLVGTLVLLPDYGLGPSFFDAVNHAMTGQSTGGFSTLDDSIAGYRSGSMEALYLVPMLLGAISLPLYYAFSRDWKPGVFAEDPQFRAMLVLLVAFTLVLAWLLAGNVAHPFREAAFQAVSALSTTGWQTSSVGDWNDEAALVIALGPMLVGGAAGATVGGVKLIRVYVIAAAIEWRVVKALLPEPAVLPFRVGSRHLSSTEMQKEVADASVFCVLYFLILAVAVAIVARATGPEFELSDVLVECVSAQSTVGLSTGITRPAMPASVELTLIFQMWVGRLEIFPVIVLLRALLPWPSFRR